MPKSSALTEQEKENGNRKLLIPSTEIQELMQPITREDFARIVGKAIPPAQPPLGVIPAVVAKAVLVQVRL